MENTEDCDSDKSLQRHASEWYANSPHLRSIIATLPWPFGPFIDTFLSCYGQNYINQRLLDGLKILGDQIQTYIDNPEYKAYIESEDFFDLLMTYFDKIVRTKQRKKMHYFALIIKNAFRYKEDPQNLDFSPSDLLNLVYELFEVDIHVLTKYLHFIKTKESIPIEEIKEKPVYKILFKYVDNSITEETYKSSLKRLESKGVIIEPDSVSGAFLGYVHVYGQYRETQLLYKLLLFLSDEENDSTSSENAKEQP